MKVRGATVRPAIRRRNGPRPCPVASWSRPPETRRCACRPRTRRGGRGSPGPIRTRGGRSGGTRRRWARRRRSRPSRRASRRRRISRRRTLIGRRSSSVLKVSAARVTNPCGSWRTMLTWASWRSSKRPRAIVGVRSTGPVHGWFAGATHAPRVAVRSARMPQAKPSGGDHSRPPVAVSSRAIDQGWYSAPKLSARASPALSGSDGAPPAVTDEPAADCSSAACAIAVVLAVVLGERQDREQVAARGTHPQQGALDGQQRIGRVRVNGVDLPGPRRRDPDGDALRPVARLAPQVRTHPIVIIARRPPVDRVRGPVGRLAGDRDGVGIIRSGRLLEEGLGAGRGRPREREGAGRVGRGRREHGCGDRAEAAILKHATRRTRLRRRVDRRRHRGRIPRRPAPVDRVGHGDDRCLGEVEKRVDARERRRRGQSVPEEIRLLDERGRVRLDQAFQRRRLQPRIEEEAGVEGGEAVATQRVEAARLGAEIGVGDDRHVDRDEPAVVMLVAGQREPRHARRLPERLVRGGRCFGGGLRGVGLAIERLVGGQSPPEARVFGGEGQVGQLDRIAAALRGPELEREPFAGLRRGGLRPGRGPARPRALVR